MRSAYSLCRQCLSRRVHDAVFVGRNNNRITSAVFVTIQKKDFFGTVLLLLHSGDYNNCINFQLLERQSMWRKHPNTHFWTVSYLQRWRFRSSFFILRDLIAALLGLLVYNASIPNKRDALLWRAIRCIKVTPYTKSYTNILISEFLIILDTTLFVWFYYCEMPVNA